MFREAKFDNSMPTVYSINKSSREPTMPTKLQAQLNHVYKYTRQFTKLYTQKSVVKGKVGDFSSPRIKNMHLSCLSPLALVYKV